MVRYNRYYTVVTYAICDIIGLAQYAYGTLLYILHCCYLCYMCLHRVIGTDIYFSRFTINYYVFMGYMCYD